MLDATSPPVAGVADRSADAAARADAKRRREAARAKKRDRDREYQKRRRAGDREAEATDARPPEDDFNPPAESPLADEPHRPEAGASAEAPPVPEFLKDPEKFAAFLASTQKMLEERTRAANRERILRVVEALGWADEKGAPTAQCQLGVSLSWKWLQDGGLDFLLNLPPGWLAAGGALILFAPAAITAWDELQDHRAQRDRAASKVVEMKPQQQGAA